MRVKWINDLVDDDGNFLPHLLPVDPTLHWANPGGLECGEVTSCAERPECCEPYKGPVPIITHLHGAHVQPDSDGYPEAWYLPDANNLEDYTTRGPLFGQIQEAEDEAGAAVFQYPNDQRATTLWYHDHTIGMTRVNVYAGPAGFYLLRGGDSDLDPDVLPGPAPSLGDAPDAKYYEIPIVIQDKSFYDDGSLFYPDNRAFFEGLEPDQLQVPFIPELTSRGEPSDVSPIWNPEFFGDTIVVNGKTWPYLDVEARAYRFRFLNGSDSRFFILKTDAPDLTFWQVGADGGFLPESVELTELLIGPAERADMIVDFSDFAGQTITLLNLGPDEPFGGGEPGVDFDPADPETTGQVMRFQVGPALAGSEPFDPDIALPSFDRLGNATRTLKVSLNEAESGTVFVPVHPVTGEFQLRGGNLVEVQGNPDRPNVGPFGPTKAMLGIVDDDEGHPVPLGWMDAITENPELDQIVEWEIYNFTMDAHPIHIHLVQFEILNRQALEVDAEGMTTSTPVGEPRDPEVWETGTKDTVIVYPGEVARVKAKFDIAGLFVWHCHILSHEDNEMMRPMYVGECPEGLCEMMRPYCVVDPEDDDPEYCGDTNVPVAVGPLKPMME